jgi:hypothetical protein
MADQSFVERDRPCHSPGVTGDWVFGTPPSEVNVRRLEREDGSWSLEMLAGVGLGGYPFRDAGEVLELANALVLLHRELTGGRRPAALAEGAQLALELEPAGAVS